jgi:hypothetical protein
MRLRSQSSRSRTCGQKGRGELHVALYRQPQRLAAFRSGIVHKKIKRQGGSPLAKGLEASQHPLYQSEKSIPEKDGRHDGDGTCDD